ncbi:hypothetical protein [Dehalobacter sp. TeCB1]|jgi:phosphomevalonate kinase|uniref:hypothetical protein n=1 Tax=Dehalobacter sp. TeCB1 TaxID=1843715 RepID=UPI00083B1FCC|nr:hypothetical protein [Dehalobacter sp. TeCB1]OCZ52203.1 hypothetical protein A7D23_11365 [Dehalobacter sp. TeCB1]
MLKNKHNQDIIRQNIMTIIKKRLSDKAHESSKQIQFGSRSLAVKMADEGSFHSGAHHTEINNLFVKNLKEYQENVVKDIEQLQTELNVKLTEKELDIIGNHSQQIYVSLLLSFHELHSKIDTQVNWTQETVYNSLLNNRTILNNIEELKLKNKEMVEKTEIVYTKKQYHLNICVLILALGSFIIAIIALIK